MLLKITTLRPGWTVRRGGPTFIGSMACRPMHLSSALRSCMLLVTGMAVPAMAQTIPAERITDWSRADLQLAPPVATVTVDITDLGGSGDGVTPNDAALAAALAAVQGQVAVIRFPPGDHLFTSTILLPDGVVLRGATADSTTLTFDLGGAGYCIAAVGQEEATHHVLEQESPRGGTQLWTTDVADLAPGDVIRLYRDDAALVVSPWALGTAGQLARVTAVDLDHVTIGSPLRAAYPPGEASYFTKLRPVEHAGIECLKLRRMDAAPPDEWSNIFFGRAADCWVRGVESERCNFAHIELFASTNCEVSGCWLHHAFAYGGGGQGYGVLAYYTAGENHIHDNLFEHLRHAMIVQAGANGNVFAYNRSVDPYWNEGLFPANAAGEIVLHGDHPYLNLFEGNIVQNIVVDDSHGKNGPFNTVFRNRASGWGLVMDTSPATDSLNIVGNEITGSPGLYLVNGQGLFAYGNNVQGTITPAGTDDLAEPSYYAMEEPGFLAVFGGWPQIGPHSVPPGSIPAAERYTAGGPRTVCEEPEPVSTWVAAHAQGPLRCFPVPFTDGFRVEGLLPGRTGVQLVLRNALGAVVLQRGAGPATPVDVSGCGAFPAGLYVLELFDDQGWRACARLLKDAAADGPCILPAPSPSR